MYSRLVTIQIVIINLIVSSAAISQETVMDESPELFQLRQEAERQIEALRSAYSLEQDMVLALRTELDQRIVAQIAFEQNEFSKLVQEAKEQAALAESGAPSVDLTPKLIEMNNKMPMQELQLVEWLEPRLPDAVVSEGRMRWEELRELRIAKIREEEERTASGPELKVSLGEAAAQGSKQISPHDNMPLPNDPPNDRYYTEIKVRDAGGEVILAPNRKTGAGSDSPPPGELTKGERLRLAQIEAAEREGRRKPGASGLQPHDDGMGQDSPRESIVIEQPPAPQVTVQVAPTPPAGQPAGRAAPSAPAAKEIVYATAPPLDDWDKYVQEHAKKVGFDDAQLTRAQAVLKDMKRRANQYRMSRSDLFAVAALKTDAKERDAMTKDLNKPIDAMFDELKQRIDSLMTHEQRQKVAAGKK